MNFTLFCPECEQFIQPQQRRCTCGWQRPAAEIFNKPNKASWISEPLGSPIRSRVVFQNDLLFCGFGKGYQPGGVAAFKRWTGEKVWQVNTQYGVEDHLLLQEKRLYYATQGMLDSDGQLDCLNPHTGESLWRCSQTLLGSACSGPLLQQGRIFISTNYGWVYAFDAESGLPCPGRGWPLQTGSGKVWLLKGPKDLILVQEDGQIFSLNLNHRDPLLEPLGDLSQRLYAPPSYWRERLFFGSSNGKLLSFNLRTRQTKTLGEDYKKIVLSPQIENGNLLVSGHNRKLRCLETKTFQEKWCFTFDHSPLAFCTNHKGLVFVTAEKDLDEGGRVCNLYALHKESGKLVWIYRFPEQERCHAPLSLCSEGQLVLGTENGSLHSLAWHLGQYEWSAAEFINQGADLQAGSAFVLALNFAKNSQKRRDLCRQAAECWDNADHPEYGARLFEEIDEQKTAALAYLKAGQAWKTRLGGKPRAAEFYLQAANLFWRLGEFIPQKEAEEDAARLAQLPNLRLQALNTPLLEQYQEGVYKFRAENTGLSGAWDLRFSTFGALHNPQQFTVEDYALAPGDYLDIDLPLIPTKEESRLKLEVSYRQQGNSKLFLRRQIELDLQVKPQPQVIKLDGIINSKIKIINKSKRPIAVEAKDMFQGEILIENGKEDDD